MRSIRIIGMLVAILLVGALGYRFIEGWDYFDSLYMTVITLATVGFSETHPLSLGGRIFTIILIMGGLGVITYGVTAITTFVIEGEMRGYIRRNRMNKAISKISDHFIVCGGGSGGHYVTEELIRTNRQVVVVEKNRERAEQLIEQGFHVVEGDATSDQTLKNAGIDNAAGLVAALSEDRDNLFVVISARGLRQNLRIVSKIVDINVKEKFLRSGADAAVSHSFIGGMRMASELIRPDTVTFLDKMLRDAANYRVEDVPVGPSFDGKTIKECIEPVSEGLLVVGHKNEGGYIFNPRVSAKVKEGDTIIVIGEPEHVRLAVSTVNQ
jgi:voltage-gated potassium channel